MDEIVPSVAPEVVVPEPTENVVVAEPTVAPTSPAEPTPISTPDWKQNLDTMDAKELADLIRTHPRIRGTVGSEIQRAIQREKDRTDQESAARAATEAEENIRKLAQEDPVAFAENWLTEDQRKKVGETLDNIHGQARHELAVSIGRAYADVPEWSKLTDEDHNALTSLLVGKSDDEVLPLFTNFAVNKIAEIRAQEKMAEWKAKELAKEREVIRQQEAAELLQSTPAPDTTPAKGLPARNSIAVMSDAEFEKYWDSRHR